MPYDPAIALQIQTPQLDIGKTLNTLSDYQLSQARSALYNQEIVKTNNTNNALQNYRLAMEAGDEIGAKKHLEEANSYNPQVAGPATAVHQTIRQQKAGDRFDVTKNPQEFDAFPEVKHTVEQTLATHDQNVRQKNIHRYQVGGQHLGATLEGPMTTESWNRALDEMVRSGHYTKEELQPHYNKPNALFASQMRYAGQLAAEQMQTGGAASENQAITVEPGQERFAPGQKRRDTPIVAPPRRRPSGGIYNEIPEVNLNMTPSEGQPGVIRPGMDPHILASKTEALKNYHDNIVPAMQSASKQKGELATLEALITKGQPLTTGKLTPVLATASAWISAITEDKKLATAITGIDPSQAEVFNKGSTRLGFELARSLGSREAVQVVQYALQSNPHPANTPEGNKTVIKLLRGAADYAIDKHKYADAWQTKNSHMAGFESWWTQSHPMETYTSKAVPLPLPEDKSQWKNNVTYEIMHEGKKTVRTYRFNINGFIEP